MSTWFLLLCQFSIIAFALIGGVLLAFSDFIMRSLGAATAPGGIEVMQTINREVFRWVFMALFLGMVPVSLVIAVYGYAALTGPAAALTALAGGLYLVGVFGVTMAFNVPLNNRLAAMDVATAAAAEFWTARYLPDWTFWNGARTAASIAAAALLLSATVGVAQA